MSYLILVREPLRKSQPTQGRLLLSNGKVLDLRIDTLELPWKNNERKVSCIPPGTYKMAWSYSQAKQRSTWEVQNVPDRDGIRIHVGNYAGEKVSDSLGCILPCLSWADLNGDSVIDGASSAIALKQLEGVLEEFKSTGIDIEIRNA